MTEANPADKAAFAIKREAEAAQSLRESLAQLIENDESLALDMIEGETSLVECIDALLLANTQDAVLVQGAERVVADIEGRATRFKNRISMRRALIEQAMVTAEIKKLERPAGTLSLSNRAPSAVVVNEADIPARFWVASDPKLDKKALAAALKDGETVAGATLSNAAPSLTIRVK